METETEERVSVQNQITQNQIQFLQNFLIINFAKRLWEIQSVEEFISGKVTEIQFGLIRIKRSSDNTIIVFTEFNSATRIRKTKNLYIILQLPDQ